MFKDGKFASRFTQRKRAGSDLYISTYALENGFVTKTVERDKSTNKSFSYNVETVIDTVKKANRGLLEKLFFASEKLNLRIKRHKVFDGVDETTALKKYVPLWTIKLSNKDQQLKATCTPDTLFVKKTTPDAWFKYSTQAKLSLGENIDNLIKNALKWFDGEFKS